LHSPNLTTSNANIFQTCPLNGTVFPIEGEPHWQDRVREAAIPICAKLREEAEPNCILTGQSQNDTQINLFRKPKFRQTKKV
jgi:hypothetical protein